MQWKMELCLCSHSEIVKYFPTELREIQGHCLKLSFHRCKCKNNSLQQGNWRKGIVTRAGHEEQCPLHLDVPFSWQLNYKNLYEE